ncbi:hypothetical protein AB8Z38_21960 [Bradyrhizobium sp. LLZ17]|uniref:Uncharacterized protein n=1 Tax=Bradyrhizobium sp. LLZ17 TaxID=3239388 RepID=A0AB39XDZ0_9BRAD
MAQRGKMRSRKKFLKNVPRCGLGDLSPMGPRRFIRGIREQGREQRIGLAAAAKSAQFAGADL